MEQTSIIALWNGGLMWAAGAVVALTAMLLGGCALIETFVKTQPTAGRRPRFGTTHERAMKPMENNRHRRIAA